MLLKGLIGSNNMVDKTNIINKANIVDETNTGTFQSEMVKFKELV